MDERITSTLESDIKHFDSARVTRLREVMKRHVDSGAVPGLVMLVHHRGREHADAMGTMGYTSKESIQRNTIFRLASMTKPITAVGAMILIEECRVRLPWCLPLSKGSRRFCLRPLSRRAAGSDQGTREQACSGAREVL